MEQLKAWVDALLAASSWDESLIAFLHATALSQWVVNGQWVWPVAETLHFIGLALLIGIIAPLDARLIGFMPRVPIAALHRMVPWAIAGFLLCLATGVIFFVGTPEQYIPNESFWMKVAFLAIAGVNMLAFELTQRPRAAALAKGAPTPAAFKVIGVLSLVSWFMVLYWGRMLPFAVGASF
jgi:hypothetical protein